MSFPGGCQIGSRPIDQTLKVFEALGATVGAPVSDAIMATRGGQIAANVLANPYVRAAGTAYGLSRLPFDARDGDYINAALDVVPFGTEAWNAARSIATGINMTRAGNWFGFSKNINPGGTRVSNPISINTTTTKIPFKPTTTTTQTRFPRWYLRGKMPMYDHYTGTTKFVNSNILEGSYNKYDFLEMCHPCEHYVGYNNLQIFDSLDDIEV